MIRTLFKKKYFYLLTVENNHKDCKFLDFLQEIKVIGDCRVRDPLLVNGPFDSQDNYWECDLIKKYNK